MGTFLGEATFFFFFFFILSEWKLGLVQWSWLNFQGRGILLIWIIVGQGPTVLAVGAGGGCLDIFFSRHFFFLPLSGGWPDID